jgi:VWFA-related protein
VSESLLSCMRSWLSVAVAVTMVAVMGETAPQTRAKTTPSEQSATFKESVNLVDVPVVVRDGSGSAVGNLRQDDFRLLDRGKPQTIRAFAAVSRAAHTVEASSTAKPDRYVAYLIDDLRLGTLQLDLVRDAVSRQLRNSIGPSDRAAIFCTSGQVMADFTPDTANLLQALRKIRMRRNDIPGAPGLVSVAVVHKVVERISTVPGQRNVVLASPGFLTREISTPVKGLVIGYPLREQIAGIVDRAVRFGVAINCLDARLLYTDRSGPFADFNADVQRSMSEVLADLAHGTGGVLFENNNDLDRGLRELAAGPQYSYVLGFSPEDLKHDGSYHAIKVTLKNAGHMEVQARPGYYEK